MMNTHVMRARAAVLAAILVASAAGVSAHVVRGLISPTVATAFVSSPTSGTDAPIPLVWTTETNVVNTGLSVVCFNVANTSAPRADRPEWPRVTSIGFELPESPSGFSLVAPTDGEWEIVESTSARLPNHGEVTLDFKIVARVHPTLWPRRLPNEPRGIPPGQNGVRGEGTRFCVSGPFPDRLPNPVTLDPADTVPSSIEGLINGAVVAFHGVDGNRGGLDVGVWDNPMRFIPLYP